MKSDIPLADSPLNRNFSLKNPTPLPPTDYIILWMYISAKICNDSEDDDKMGSDGQWRKDPNRYPTRAAAAPFCVVCCTAAASARQLVKTQIKEKVWPLLFTAAALLHHLTPSLTDQTTYSTTSESVNNYTSHVLQETFKNDHVWCMDSYITPQVSWLKMVIGEFEWPWVVDMGGEWEVSWTWWAE